MEGPCCYHRQYLQFGTVAKLTKYLQRIVAMLASCFPHLAIQTRRGRSVVTKPRSDGEDRQQEKVVDLLRRLRLGCTSRMLRRATFARGAALPGIR